MKLSNRDKYILVGLLIAVFGYLFYTYAYVPLKEEKAVLKEELSLLEPQMKDLTILTSDENSKSKNKNELEGELKNLKESRGFDNVPYQELITYLGQKADDFELDITSFTRMELNDRGEYQEIPYDLRIEGDYVDITRFVNSIYELDKYFFITDIEMFEKDVLPLELMLQNGDKIPMPFDWAQSFIDRLNKGIPVESIVKGKEGLSPYELEDKVEQKIQLSFKFYFVSMNNKGAGNK